MTGYPFNNRFLHKGLLCLLILLAATISVRAQEPAVVKPASTDSAPAVIKKPWVNKYDSSIKAHNPKVAALRSALLPGLGQIYNKKYWKLPIIYGALGVTSGIFIYNLNYYKATRFAYTVKYNMRVLHIDSAKFAQIKSELKPLDEESLRSYRNQFRRDIDYSAILFLVFWGLNVVDATVDAHMKSFDVSPDLSFKIKPGYSSLAQTNGISLILSLKDKHAR